MSKVSLNEFHSKIKWSYNNVDIQSHIITSLCDAEEWNFKMLNTYMYTPKIFQSFAREPLGQYDVFGRSQRRI